MMPGQRVELLKRAVAQAEKISDELEVRLTEMETVITETQVALADPNLPAAFRDQLNDILTQTIEGIKVVSEKRGEYAGLISRLRQQLEEAETEGMDFGDELSLYGEGLKTIGPTIPPPIGPIITVVGAVFGILGTMLAKKRKAELVGVVKSVDKLLESNTIPDAKAATTVLKNNQPPNIRSAVIKIKS